MKISFDFDDTLTKAFWVDRNFKIASYGPYEKYVKLAQEYDSNGDEVYIVTARSNSYQNKELIKSFIKENGLNIKEIVCTNHTPKGPFLKDLKIDVHYDDREDQIISATKYGIKGILVEFEQLS